MDSINNFSYCEPDYDNPGLIHKFVEHYAYKTPKQTAVVYKEIRISYRELIHSANKVANELTLRQKQLGKINSRVIVFLNRNHLSPIALIGVFKANCVYVPVNHKTPVKRIGSILIDSESEFIICERALRPFMDELDIDPSKIIDIENLLKESDNTKEPDVVISSNDLAYIIYTSGSSGTPKGVPIRHYILCNQILGWQQLTPAYENLNGTLIASFSYDNSLWEHFFTLAWGGELHVLDETTILDSKALASYILENRIISANIPPALIDSFLEEFEKTNKPFPLKRFIAGGESVNVDFYKRFKKLNPEIELIVGYGPTEAGITATLVHFDENQKNDLGYTTIGKALPGYYIYIVDENIEKVPFGEEGEILIGGDILADGYIKNEELTKEKYIDDKFGNNKDGRLYKTGDLGKFLSNGDLLFLGRIDDQVKIRGNRIELGEIESVLKEISGTSNVVVITEKEGLEKKIIVYLEKANKNKSEIREELSKVLPHYMLPSAIINVNKFPLNLSNKVDKSKLPKPTHEDYSDDQFVSPSTKEEKMISSIITNIIHVENIGVTDNIYDYGFNSIALMKLITKINEGFEIEVEVDKMFALNTIRSFADYISEMCVDRSSV